MAVTVRRRRPRVAEHSKRRVRILRTIARRNPRQFHLPASNSPQKPTPSRPPSRDLDPANNRDPETRINPLSTHLTQLEEFTHFNRVH